MNLEQHLEVAVSAVREASAVCRRVQADLVNAGTVSKDDKSPVTVADFAAQAVICARLGAAFADLPVVGEEGSEALRNDPALLATVAGHAGLGAPATLEAIDRGGWTPDGSKPVYWTLDPIDGTKGFLRGEQYAVALGLIADGKVVLGVLGCPNLDGGLLMVGGVGDGTGSAAVGGGRGGQRGRRGGGQHHDRLGRGPFLRKRGERAQRSGRVGDDRRERWASRVSLTASTASASTPRWPGVTRTSTCGCPRGPATKKRCGTTPPGWPWWKPRAAG